MVFGKLIYIKNMLSTYQVDGDANEILTRLKRDTLGFAFYKFEIIEDGGIPDLIAIKLEHVAVRYKDGDYKHLLELAPMKYFRADLNVMGDNLGRLVTTSDIRLADDSPLKIMDRGVPLFYIQGGKRLHVRLYARVGSASEHARWAPFLYGTRISDTTLLQNGRRTSDDMGENVTIHMVTKGTVTPDSLFEWASSAMESPNLVSDFIRTLEDSNFYDILNALGTIDVSTISTPDLSPWALDAPLAFIQRTLICMLATCRSILLQNGVSEDRFPKSGERMKKQIDMYLSTRLTGVRGENKRKELERKLLFQETPPTDFLITILLSLVAGAYSLDDGYSPGKGANLESIEKRIQANVKPSDRASMDFSLGAYMLNKTLTDMVKLYDPESIEDGDIELHVPQFMIKSGVMVVQP